MTDEFDRLRTFSTSSRNTQTAGRRGLHEKAQRRRSGRETWVPSCLSSRLLLPADACSRSFSSSPSSPSFLYVPSLDPEFGSVIDRTQLPLSFLTSFFALSLDIFPKDPETGDTNWPAGEVLGYLCMFYLHRPLISRCYISKTDTRRNVVGFSAIIFIPLILLALYVNQLKSKLGAAFQQVLQTIDGQKKTADKPRVEVEVDSKDYDSDKLTVANDRARTHVETFTRRSGRSGFAGTHRSYGGGGDDDDHGGAEAWEGVEFDPPYAEMFGRYVFHQGIPVLRNLWRHGYYRERGSRNNRLKDRYIIDYPLNHYRTIVWSWLLFVLEMVCGPLRSKKSRRRRRREKKGEDMSSGESEGSGGSEESGDRDNVDRRDFGLGGGRWRLTKKKETPQSTGKKRPRSMRSGSWRPRSVANGSRAAESMSRWSNQTRSRVSVPLEAEWDVEVEREWGGNGDGGGYPGYPGYPEAFSEDYARGWEEPDQDTGGETGGEMAMPEVNEEKKGKLSWLSLRRRRKNKPVDEENEVGAVEGVLEEQARGGKRRWRR